MTRAEHVSVEFVAQKLRLKASWTTIARMTGASEASLRRRFDPEFALVAPTAVTPPSPRDRVHAALCKTALGTDGATIIARLWQANGARLRPKVLAQGIGGASAASQAVAEAKRIAMRLGIEFAPTQGRVAGQALSDRGVVKISKLAGLGGEPDGRGAQ